MNNGLETIVQPTINGLKSLNLDTLDVDTLQSNNIDGEFFSIETIEANDVQVDNELELTNSGFITIGKNTAQEITITDTQVGYLDGITSNIQTQINNAITDTSQIQADLTTVEQEVDILNDKTIYQSSNTTELKTILSNKLILSSLSNLDVGVEIQANTANVGILTTQQSTNTSNISTNTSNLSSLSTQQTTNTSNISSLSTQQSTNTSNISTNANNISTNTSNISSLSTQQTTNTFNITQQGLSIGQPTGPVNSLFNRVRYITTNNTDTYIEGKVLQRNSSLTTTNIELNGGIMYMRGVAPNIYFYRNGVTGGQSGIIGFNSNDDTLKINNYQTDKNISIFTRTGSTSAEINLTSNYVKANGVDINVKFNTIDSDILGNSNAITSLNVSINNNLSKIQTNTNLINALQTEVPPVGSIMMYAGGSAPTGWYICNGALISKSSNIELWSLLGNTYLAGRPAQTLSFYLPDMRQLFVTGAGDNSTYAVNASNKSVGDYNSQSIMEHGHNYERPTNTFKASQSTFGTNVWRSNTQATTSGGVILPGGGIIATDSENKPYCMAMNYIIKK